MYTVRVKINAPIKVGFGFELKKALEKEEFERRILKAAELYVKGDGLGVVMNPETNRGVVTQNGYVIGTVAIEERLF